MEADPPINDEGLRFLLAPPPIHPEDPASPRPEWIILDPFGYISDRTNGTTAEACTADGRSIAVTFWAAAPPRVSCFTFHCPDVPPSALGNAPTVVCAEDDLAFLRVAICPRNDQLDAENNQYFVYQAGSQNEPPSLKLVSAPRGLMIYEHEAVLLRCRDLDMYFVAVLKTALLRGAFDERQFDLHLYNSKTERWSTTLMHADSHSRQDFLYNYTTKALTIGGELGSVCWVDLWRGILICDILLDNHILRYIRLPSLVPKPPRGFPSCNRNIIVLDGYIKYFELHKFKPACPTCGAATSGAKGWVATTWKMEISSIGSGNIWEEDCTIKSNEISVHSLVSALLLPNRLEGGVNEPIFDRTYVGYPALSLHDGDVVYMVHKRDPQVDKASYVIAVDMSNKTLKGVADFGSGRPLGYNFYYLQSRISKHLGV